MIMAVVDGSQLRVEKPNTVPAAGGCSVSVTAITRIKTPTERARLRCLTKFRSSRKSATGAANKIRDRTERPPVSPGSGLRSRSVPGPYGRWGG